MFWGVRSSLVFPGRYMRFQGLSMSFRGIAEDLGNVPDALEVYHGCSGSFTEGFKGFQG